MAKDKNYEEEIFEDDILVEMQDEDGNSYYYVEEMRIPVGDETFALLVEAKLDDEGDEEEHRHCHHEGCDCGGDCDCGDVIIAKIVLDDDGEEIYIEPTDEEFEAVQDAYERLMEEENDEF